MEIDTEQYTDGSLTVRFLTFPPSYYLVKLLDVQLEVEVFHRGFSGKRSVHVGEGKASLKSLIPAVGQATPFVINLVYHGKSGDRKEGQVRMIGTLQEISTIDTSVVKVIEPVAIEKINDDAKEEMLTQNFGDVGELLYGKFLLVVICF